MTSLAHKILEKNQNEVMDIKTLCVCEAQYHYKVVVFFLQVTTQMTSHLFEHADSLAWNVLTYPTHLL